MNLDETGKGTRAEKAAFKKYMNAKQSQNKLDDFECCVYDVPIAEWTPEKVNMSEDANTSFFKFAHRYVTCLSEELKRKDATRSPVFGLEVEYGYDSSKINQARSKGFKIYQNLEEGTGLQTSLDYADFASLGLNLHFLARSYPTNKAALIKEQT